MCTYHKSINTVYSERRMGWNTGNQRQHYSPGTVAAEVTVAGVVEVTAVAVDDFSLFSSVVSVATEEGERESER